MKEDWSCLDDMELDEDQIKEIRPVPLEEIQRWILYAVHKHPVYVSTSALFSFSTLLMQEHMMMRNREQPPANLSWS